MKKALRLVFSILMSCLFLYLAFRKANIREVRAIIMQADIWLLLWAYLISIIGLMLRSYRWKLLGKDFAPVPWRYFFQATTMGLSLNAFLPFRSGDLFQGLYLSLKSGLSKSYTFSTVFLERLVDFVSPVLMLAIGSYFIALPQEVPLKKIVGLGVFGVIAILVAVKNIGRIVDLLVKIPFIGGNAKITGFLGNLAKAAVFLKEKQFFFAVIPITLANWFIISVAVNALVLRSVGISLNYVSIMLILGITVMSLAIPASPGFVGTWEYFCLLALGVFNIQRDIALSFALVSHFIAFLPVISVGMVFFIHELLVGKFKLGDFKRAAMNERADEQ